MGAPLDVSINKPTEDGVCVKCNEWIVNEEHLFTKGRSMHARTLFDVAQWIVDVWKDLNPSLICKGFQKCCISNNLDRKIWTWKKVWKVRTLIRTTTVPHLVTKNTYSRAGNGAEFLSPECFYNSKFFISGD